MIRYCTFNAWPLLVAIGLAWPALAQTPSVETPPRTITDIKAILEQEKPDSQRVARLKSKADASAPDTTDQRVLARFYQQRAENRGTLGRIHEAVADIKIAISIGRHAHMQAALPGFYNQLAVFEQVAGNLNLSLEASRQSLAAMSPDDMRYGRFQAHRLTGVALIGLSQLQEAEGVITRNEQLLAEVARKEGPEWNAGEPGIMAGAYVHFGNAALAEAQGKYAEAAKEYLKAEELYRRALAKAAPDTRTITLSTVRQVAEWMVARRARALARQGDLSEAEAEARRSMTNWLRQGGKYNLNTARILGVFTMILVEEGLYDEAGVSIARSP